MINMDINAFKKTKQSSWQYTGVIYSHVKEKSVIYTHIWPFTLHFFFCAKVQCLKGASSLRTDTHSTMDCLLLSLKVKDMRIFHTIKANGSINCLRESQLSWLLLISLFPKYFMLLWLVINSYTCNL